MQELQKEERQEEEGFDYCGQKAQKKEKPWQSNRERKRDTEREGITFSPTAEGTVRLHVFDLKENAENKLFCFTREWRALQCILHCTVCVQ